MLCPTRLLGLFPFHFQHTLFEQSPPVLSHSYWLFLRPLACLLHDTIFTWFGTLTLHYWILLSITWFKMAKTTKSIKANIKIFILSVYSITYFLIKCTLWMKYGPSIFHKNLLVYTLFNNTWYLTFQGGYLLFYFC